MSRRRKPYMGWRASQSGTLPTGGGGLPPKGPRSPHAGKRVRASRPKEGVQAPRHRDIDLPEVFVRVPPADGRGCWRYAQARIVLRRGVYRYLVWKENGRKRMLYLGKVKISALLARSRPGAPGGDVELQQGGQESGEKP